MDEAMVRKRCEEILSGAPITSDELVVYRAAYADGQRAGMERAADRIVKTHKSIDSDKWLDLASELKTQTADGAEIRQAAGEVK